MATPTWKCIAQDPIIQRSSHVLSVLDRKALLFGGELVPREPRDNSTIAIDLEGADVSIRETATSAVPSARVGSASTTLSSKLYLFSGRGGPSMSPTEENGRLWCFDPSLSTWTLVDPLDASKPHPSARSYHCMTSDGIDKIFIHAGCPSSGRLGDLWMFSISERNWTQLADAPGPQRGGASIVFDGGKLYRMNGFDGKTEQGGSIDCFDLLSGKWSEKKFVADGIEGPEARSVSTLLSVATDGKPALFTMFGERDPSSLGHAGAGKMLSDCWLYNIASNSWRKVDADIAKSPPARGWFDADTYGESKVILAGGLSENNERLDDVWILSL